MQVVNGTIFNSNFNGTVAIKSIDPMVDPNINLNMFSDDVTGLVNGSTLNRLMAHYYNVKSVADSNSIAVVNPSSSVFLTSDTLAEFIKKNNIGKCIIPETCWYRIFQMAKLMRDNNVNCYAIPNIEIVRKDEIVKHKYFYKIKL
jgi:hypothetical protein